MSSATNVFSVWVNTVAHVRHPYHVILFIINIIFPGWGTIFSSCMDIEREEFNGVQLVRFD